MNISISFFITLFIILAAVSSIFTEAIKKFCINRGGEAKPNIIAFLCALVIGGGGTVAAFTIYEMAFTLNSIIFAIVMVFFIWIGSMIGYDKVKQTIEQFKKI